MSKNEHELFELFFKSITMRMNPPMDEYTNMRRYWQERFSNAFHGQKESLRNESYAELPIMWLAAWRMQQQEIDTKDKQLIEQGQRFNTQSQQIASLKKQLERLGCTDNGCSVIIILSTTNLIISKHLSYRQLINLTSCNNYIHTTLSK